MPLQVVDGEAIVRCLFAPSHFDKEGKVKPAAFHPKAGSDKISTIRHDFVGTDFCKLKAKEMESSTRSYRGLGVLTAKQIRLADCEVEDSREAFCGHADINMGFVVPEGDPLPSPESDALLKRKRELAKHIRYFQDPTPNEAKWLGEKVIPN